METLQLDGRTRQLTFCPAYSTPEHGNGAMKMIFALKGKAGAIVFDFNTQWYNEAGIADMVRRVGKDGEKHGSPFGILSFHSPIPLALDQSENKCSHTETGTCYSGSTYCNEDIVEELLSHGEARLWEILNERYEKELCQSFDPTI